MDLDSLVQHIDRQIKTYVDLVNTGPIITDSGSDITDLIKGKLNAYIDIKYILEGAGRHPESISTPIEEGPAEPGRH